MEIKEGGASKPMSKFFGKIPPESVIDVTGTIAKAEIKSDAIT